VEDLSDAAYVIAHTAHRLFQPESCGLLLFASDGNKEAEAQLPHKKTETPYELVQQVMESRQLIYLSEDEDRAVVCVPIQTNRRCYGVLWMKIKEGPDSYHVPEKILHLMNQAVVALERSILLVETQQKSLAIEKAYHQQEESYDRFLEALMELLEYRDGETEEHSKRVRELSEKLARSMGVSKSEMKALNQGAKLHDIGKIGVRDAVLLKKGPLNEEEWKEMRQHPTIGANVVQLIAAYQDAIPIIYYHQERWDGSGYPLGLSGPSIPLLARIFAVVDVYDALTSDRPYRTRMKPIEALEYLESQAGVHFDPLVVEHMTRIVREMENLSSTE
jgi:putative nucleotidyltransferase with HDIG domain